MQTLWSYTNNNFLENIRGRPFIIATKYIKCMVLNVKNLYEENLKHFQKSTQIVFNKCKDTLFFLSSYTQYHKGANSPKLIYKYKISIKCQ